MRGKACHPLLDRRDHRITPAYAGKSPRLCRSLPVQGDHPRLCGEKVVDWIDGFFDKGSPPPMRGKEQKHVNENGDTGITPAYAGKREVGKLDQNNY